MKRITTMDEAHNDKHDIPALQFSPTPLVRNLNSRALHGPLKKFYLQRERLNRAGTPATTQTEWSVPCDADIPYELVNKFCAKSQTSLQESRRYLEILCHVEDKVRNFERQLARHSLLFNADTLPSIDLKRFDEQPEVKSKEVYDEEEEDDDMDSAMDLTLSSLPGTCNDDLIGSYNENVFPRNYHRYSGGDNDRNELTYESHKTGQNGLNIENRLHLGNLNRHQSHSPVVVDLTQSPDRCRQSLASPKTSTSDGGQYNGHLIKPDFSQPSSPMGPPRVPPSGLLTMSGIQQHHHQLHHPQSHLFRNTERVNRIFSPNHAFQQQMDMVQSMFNKPLGRDVVGVHYEELLPKNITKSASDSHRYASTLSKSHSSSLRNDPTPSSTERSPLETVFLNSCSGGGGDANNDEFENGFNAAGSISTNATERPGEVSSDFDTEKIDAGAQRKRVSSSSSSGNDPIACKTPRRTSYQRTIEKVSCQVCGDVASGFHCGAYVCEACKKFFIRSCKNDNLKYVCSKNQQCAVTKESRTQCQHCRYQKCLNIGMFKPGTNIFKGDTDISHIPCKVCGAPSSGFHFGAITCEGCKGFFRRTIKERDSFRYSCAKGANCQITMATRNICKFCRYQKCLDAGMTPDGSRIGRQPNSVKHATMLELQKLYKNKEPLPSSETNQNLMEMTSMVMRTIETPSQQTYISNGHENGDVVSTTRPMTPANDNCFTPIIPKKEIVDDSDLMEIQDALKSAYRHLELVRYKETDNGPLLNTDQDYVWARMMKQFTHDAHCVLKFAKKIPGFRNFDVGDQITLLQSSLYQIVLFILSNDYHPENHEYNYFNFAPEERDAIFLNFPPFRMLQTHFFHMGQMLIGMELDSTEFAYMSALQLVASDEFDMLKSAEAIDSLQEKIMLSFQAYINEKEGSESNRCGYLLLRLGELRQASIQHQLAVFELRKRYPDLPFPQLFTEMFLNNNDDEDQASP